MRCIFLSDVLKNYDLNQFSSMSYVMWTDRMTGTDVFRNIYFVIDFIEHFCFFFSPFFHITARGMLFNVVF